MAKLAVPGSKHQTGVGYELNRLRRDLKPLIFHANTSARQNQIRSRTTPETIVNGNAEHNNEISEYAF